MKRISPLICCLLVLTGCVAVEETVVDQPATISKRIEKSVPSAPAVEKQPVDVPAEKVVQEDEVKEPEILKGVVMGKTLFTGVLEYRNVRLVFKNMEKPAMVFRFQISNGAKQQILPWDVKPLDPGYFFIELPAGRYKIESISAFVGTTLATENTDIEFAVQPNTAVYIGTLKIDGTKEKIKLGGLPVIQPGFEYVAEVIDQNQEAKTVFQQRFPDASSEIVVDLMKILQK